MYRKFRVAAAVCSVTTVAVVGQAAPARAVDAHWHEFGELKICNHSGYAYGVWADGLSARGADLAGFDECRQWHVRAGRYDIGFEQRITSADQRVIAQARIERGPYTIYKEFDPRGVITTGVSGAYPTRIDLFIPQH